MPSSQQYIVDCDFFLLMLYFHIILEYTNIRTYPSSYYPMLISENAFCRFMKGNSIYLPIADKYDAYVDVIYKYTAYRFLIGFDCSLTMSKDIPYLFGYKTGVSPL